MKLLSRIILSTTLFYGLTTNAETVIRKASARVTVNKITMTKVNGSYERNEVEVCDKKSAFPVTDQLTAGTVSQTDRVIFECESTVTNQPVVIKTTPVLSVGSSNQMNPLSKDPVTPIKMIGAFTEVSFKKSDLYSKLLQEATVGVTYSKDLNLREVGFNLMPRLEMSSSSCSSSDGHQPADCKSETTVNYEEYFVTYVYIEDTNK